MYYKISTLRKMNESIDAYYSNILVKEVVRILTHNYFNISQVLLFFLYILFSILT